MGGGGGGTGGAYEIAYKYAAKDIFQKFNPLSDEYIPYKCVFKPLYNSLRHKYKINQYISIMATSSTSALLHSTPFLIYKDYNTAKIAGGIFLAAGILMSLTKFLENKKRKRKLETLLKN